MNSVQYVGVDVDKGKIVIAVLKGTETEVTEGLVFETRGRRYGSVLPSYRDAVRLWAVMRREALGSGCTAS